MTTGFIDNDILLKLVAFQLLENALSVLGLTQSDLRLLPSAKFVFRQESLRQSTIYPQSVWQQAISIAESCQKISMINAEFSAEAIVEAQQLELISEVHQGELALILATRNMDSFLFISGDKNCIKALSQLPTKTYKRLCGRVICLEQLVLSLIDSVGFETISHRIIPFIQCDKAIHFCFGYSRLSPESQVREALQSCIDEIHSVAPGLLVELS